ncbi:MAG: hypothetical protein ACFFBT_05355 [Promethearchaeota archaeon]
MPELNYLIDLVSKAAEGVDNFSEGAVGFNSYGFVFRNYEHDSVKNFITNWGSSTLCSIGAYKDIYKKFKKNMDKIKSPMDLLDYDPKLDLCFGGALKTLLPDLEFGKFEILFNVWVLVRTSKNQLFPATFYYKDGPTIGAWDSNYIIFTQEKVFPKEFEAVINFTPFNFSEIELEEFIDAFESALDKVPISDFQVKFTHDLGHNLVGVRNGQPFIEYLDPNDIEPETWSYCIMGNSEADMFEFEFIEIMNDHLTPEEIKIYSKDIPDSMDKILIERAYEKLIIHAYSKNSRLAFLVLGQFLMSFQGKMDVDLKKVILECSDWKYEKHQLENEDDRKDRKRYLADFQEKIKEYNGTQRISLSFEPWEKILKKNIDYSIN